MSEPAWWGGKAARKRQNGRSRRQERKVARDLGGRVQAGSGSSWRARQDVKTDDEMVQVKYTDKDSFTLRAKEWEGIVADALKNGREPAMIVEFPHRHLRLRITEG